jgi:hypothetical protein
MARFKAQGQLYFYQLAVSLGGVQRRSEGGGEEREREKILVLTFVARIHNKAEEKEGRKEGNACNKFKQCLSFIGGPLSLLSDGYQGLFLWE